MQVCNNGCWALGELAIKVPHQVKPYVKELIESLEKILNSDILTILSKRNDAMLKHFSKSVSITLGRIALVDPVESSKCLPKVIKPWCLALRYINDCDEKN
jgi:hypothetical protein